MLVLAEILAFLTAADTAVEDLLSVGQAVASALSGKANQIALSYQQVHDQMADIDKAVDAIEKAKFGATVK